MSGSFLGRYKKPKGLLQETLAVMEQHGKNPSDVRWVGSEEFGYFTWADFAEVANERYYSGFGAQEVATDLMIVGDDWWMERGEYDGSEWWEFVRPIQKPETYRKPHRVMGGMWDTLSELNGAEPLPTDDDVIETEFTVKG